LEKSYWVGVDTGGTFTDALAIDSEGQLHLAKTPSTPDDLSIGVINSLERLAESAGVSMNSLLANTVKLAHGTTATVNAMVQRRGARVGLITTRGFRDHFILMKAARGVGVPEGEKARFSRAVKPEPLVPYSLTEEVAERIDHAGRVVLELDEDDARRAIQSLLDHDVEAIAISLLWAFRNPAHELRLRAMVRDMAPRLPVSVASSLVPVIGEYERTTTAVINAYLGPVLDRYVHKLKSSLAGAGLTRPLLLMQSDGGLIPGEAAPDRAVTTMLSGLAAGVLGAKQVGDELGEPNVIAIDMGGTSFEVSLVHDGVPVMENFPLTPRLAPYEARWRIANPMIDITAIGAGGGSIARVEEGVLKVGPQSAAAEPGPACYGRGGTRPTVTDAFLVLGYLSPDNFLGGRMQVDRQRSVTAIEEHVARPLDIDVYEAADGIYRVVISQMADLIHKVTIERGYDVRDFVMVAFGGCGPIHAGVLGEESGVPKVIIPGAGAATALSAYGLVMSDLRYSVARSHPLAEPIAVEAVAEALNDVSQSAAETIAGWGIDTDDVGVALSIDMRFVGQAHALNVGVPGVVRTDSDLSDVFDRFVATYERSYGAGTAHRAAGIEMVTFRADATGQVTKRDLPRSGGGKAGTTRPSHSRTVYFGGSPTDDVPIYAGGALGAGARIAGPAVIEYAGNTIVAHPGQTILTDEQANLVFNFKA